MCDYCHIDEIDLFDIPKCTICSISELFHELFQKKDASVIFTKDRIYYVVFIFILIMLIRLFFKCLMRHKYEQTYNPIWEEYGRWYP